MLKRSVLLLLAVGLGATGLAVVLFAGRSPSRTCESPGSDLEAAVVAGRGLEPLVDYSTMTPVSSPGRMERDDVPDGACEFVFLDWNVFEDGGDTRSVQLVRFSEELPPEELEPFRRTGSPWVVVEDGVEQQIHRVGENFSGLYMLTNGCITTVVRPAQPLDIEVWTSHLDDLADQVCGLTP